MARQGCDTRNTGTAQGPLKAKFALIRVRTAEGRPIGSGCRQPPEEAQWLVCEWRTTGEKEVLPVQPPARDALKTLVRAIKAQSRCEQKKNRLGLDHLECRGWQALQHPRCS